MDKCKGPASICVSFKAVISFMLIRKHANGSEIPAETQLLMQAYQ